MNVEDVLRAIASGPDGPRIGAFFDLDGTLVEGYTASAFYSQRLRQGEIGPGELLRTLFGALDLALGGDPARIGESSVAALQGQSEDRLVELGERLFVQKIAGTIRPEARELVRAHRRRGHTVAVASSATRFQIAPIARDLGIEHVLCTELAAADGVLTGKLAGDLLWGEPKAAAVRKFSRARKIDLKYSHAYANGAEDVPFLSSVGQPCALNPHPGLAAAAQQQKWPVLMLREPRKAGVRALLGTAAALAGFNVGLAFGAAVGQLHGDRRFGTKVGFPLACDLLLALAGVKLEIAGEHNLWRARPAVFIANHQSGLDPFIVASLVRGDITGVGKKELRNDPRVWLGGRLLDIAFIDRSSPEQARKDVSALVERIKSGTSALIAPEGTRTATQTLRPFKKGAFHLAMQAGVPIVPVVIRNAGELMWRRSMVIHPGTIQVAVLDPVPTDGWTAATLDEQVARVRERMAATLDQWPATP